MDEQQVDEFFDGVAGKRSQRKPPAALHRLGSTTRASVLRRRDWADGALSDRDAHQRDALLDSLDKRGLFRDPDASTVTRLQRGTRVFTNRWARPVAFAAILALCAVGVMQFLPFSRTGPTIVERGSADLTLRAIDPAATERELAQELAAAGAEVQGVQINDSTWSLSIDLSKAASGRANVHERVHSILAKYGVAAPNDDQLSLIIELPAEK
jgi:hypothetical protein